MTKKYFSVDDLFPIANLLKSWNAYWTPSYKCNLHVVRDFINRDSIWTVKELYSAIKAGFIYNNGLAVVYSPRGCLMVKAPQKGCAGVAIFFKR